MDEAGIKREATITSCWCIKDKTSVVLSPATHDKINLVGAVKVGSGEVIGHEVERFDRYAMIGFLELILEKESNGRGPIYIILDNAKPHKAKDVQEFLKTKGQRFIMMYLPPYSPELNPSENIWRQLRKEKTHNVLFKTLGILRSTVTAFFNKYAVPNEKMSRLCALC